jgi:hypothetical protein
LPFTEKSQISVFARQHDREDAQGLGRVARVFAAHVAAGAEANATTRSAISTVATKPRSRMPLVMTFLPRLMATGSRVRVDLRKRSFNSAMRFALVFVMTCFPLLSAA